MFNLALPDVSIEPKILDSLGMQADSEITIRGYELDKVGVPPELGKVLFCPLRRMLSFGLIISIKEEA